MGGKSTTTANGRISFSINLSQGSTFSFREYDFGDNRLIPYKQGYLAYAISFNLLLVRINENAKTLLLELDEDFALVKPSNSLNWAKIYFPMLHR